MKQRQPCAICHKQDGDPLVCASCLLAEQMRDLGYKGTREFHFHKSRKWAIDLAYPANLLAVEVEGAVWTQGRHTRGSGFVKDIEKYNALALLGWRLLRFTPQMVEDGTAAKTVSMALIQDAALSGTL